MMMMVMVVVMMVMTMVMTMTMTMTAMMMIIIVIVPILFISSIGFVATTVVTVIIIVITMMIRLLWQCLVFCGKDAQAATKLHPKNADDSLTMQIFYIYRQTYNYSCKYKWTNYPWPLILCVRII